jgi:branched-chain amino acid aminotransferase
MVREGRVVTPPAWEGALESITVDLVEVACGTLGIRFERRPIDRTELLIADEVALAGTLVEVTAVRSIDGVPMPGGDVIEAIQSRYLAMVQGTEPHAAVGLSSRPPPALSVAAE